MTPVLEAALLAVLDQGIAGWVVGLAWALTVGLLVRRGLGAAGRPTLGPADHITLVRAVLVGAVTATVAESRLGAAVVLASIAIGLDLVDGAVARMTHTASDFGARFDMEVDAFLILVLSVAVARDLGAWVLLIGAARYLLWVAERFAPWLRNPVPPRYWRKTVAAIQAVTLTAAVAGVLPLFVTIAVVAISLALLVESFGRDVWWLWHTHRAGTTPERFPLPGWGVNVLAVALVWFALVAPDRLDELTPTAFIRVPIEGLVLVALAVVLPPRMRIAVLSVLGAALGALTLAKFLDMGFYAQLDRPFNPVSDWSSLTPALSVLRRTLGHGKTVVIVIAVIVVAVAIVVGTPLALLRLTRRARAHRTATLRAVAALTLLWAVGVVTGAPVASDRASVLAYDEARAVHYTINDRQAFATTLSDHDAYAITPSSQLLSGLRGKDVVIAFVESYGQVAVQDSSIAPKVDALLRRGSAELESAGYDSRSAFLTSPTFGGISWLAHSTLQSGLRIDTQQRYDQLMTSHRFTLTGAFGRAGWRTVADVPSDGANWPEGRSFYGYDKIYGATNVGYAGRDFGYATMSDQYVLSSFRRLELAKQHRRPVMAEIDLVSSHTPWAPLPAMVSWQSVGDGSSIGTLAGKEHSLDYVWQRTDRIRAAYGISIRYTLSTLISFLSTYHDPNLVLVVLGDHQPAPTVSGSDATHNVPISVISSDPDVFTRMSSWHWQPGLLPDPAAPVWPMESFRDRFLTTFDKASG